MNYAYTALEPTGERKDGFIEAASQEEAMRSITADGRFVLDIAEEAPATRGFVFSRGRSVSKSDLALFTRRLADLSAAGLPLDRVLQVVGEQSESSVLSEVCLEVLTEVRSGRPVSDALALHPRLFNDVFTQTLRAGEASGQFPEVAQRLADFQEKEVTRRSQIISALIYPAILAGTAIVVVIFMLTFVVPKLSSIFKDLGNDLPLTTKILLASTDFLTKNGLWILALLVASIIGYRAWVAQDIGALTRDRFRLKLPIIGPVIRKATVSRFSRILGTLIYGGVPILEALRLAGLAAGNRQFRLSSERLESQVREGQPIAIAMKLDQTFPPVLTNMVSVGEETGNLPIMLSRVSDSLDFEVDNGMRRLTALVEPIIVLFMGTFVGFVVLSIILPIYQAQDVVK